MTEVLKRFEEDSLDDGALPDEWEKNAKRA